MSHFVSRPMIPVNWVYKCLVLIGLLSCSFQTVLSQYTTSTCSGTAFSFTPPGATPGTTYSWAAPSSIPSGSVTGTSQNNLIAVSDLLTNNTSTPVTVVYAVTPSSGGNFQLLVTVNPLPKLSSSLTPSTCSGTVFNYIPTSATSGATFVWTRVLIPVISNPSNSGSGSPNETLVNTTSVTQTVNYVYTTFANACSSSESVAVQVFPNASINNLAAAPASVCSGSIFNFSPTSLVLGATFNWTRAAVTGISNTAASGTGNPSEALINTTPSPVTVLYTYTSSANGCNYVQTLPVIVNPLPTLSSTVTPPAICSGTTFNYTPTSVQSVSFAWSRSVNANINSGNGPIVGTNDPAEFLVNNGIVNTSANYSYTLTNTTTGCFRTQIVSVVVKPVPSVASPQSVVGACSANSFSFSPSGVPNGTLYTWGTPVITAGGTGSLTGGAAVSVGQTYIGQTLTNNTTSSASIQYTVTPSNNGCTGTDFILNVSVNSGGSAISISNPVAPGICSGNVFSYTPNSTATVVSYTWQRFLTSGISTPPNAGSGNVNEILTNTTTQPITVYYAYTLTTNSCSNTQLVSVTVNPTPFLNTTLSPVAVCSNSLFTYVPTAPAYVTTFNWTRAVVIGISNTASNGTNNINETLVNTTTNSVSVNYNYTLTSSSGCSNTQTVSVLITPSPVLNSSLNPPAICSGGTFNYTPTSNTGGTVFSWTRTAQTSIGNAAGTGANDPAETLVNTSTDAVTVPYVYTLSAGGCINTQIINAIVNPSPNITDKTATICNNNTFTVTPSNVPAGTLYTWTLPTSNPVNAVNGGSLQAIGQTNISQTLTNSIANSGTATYVVTPVAGACTGVNFNVVVTVNPIPVLSSSLNPSFACSNAVFNYTPTSTTANSFAWTRATVAGISNASSSGTGAISETLINTSTLPVTINYIFTITTPSGCTNVQTVTVSVNPSPSLTSTVTPSAICSGSIFNYTPLSSIPGATINWTRAAQLSISNAAANGTNDPAEILVNTSINQVSVPYNFTLAANGCSNTQTVNLLINPSPVVSNQVKTACNNTAFIVAPTNVPANTKYTWANPSINPAGSINGGSAQAILQNNISQTLVNSSINIATATYIVTPNANGCVGADFTVVVTVTNIPVLSSSLAPAPVCSNQLITYNPTSSTAGTSFNWTRGVVTGVSNAAASGTNGPNESLINTTSAAINVSYNYSLTSAVGCVNTQVVTIQVNPSPTLSSSLNPAAICSGGSFNYTPTSATPLTTFTWSRSAVASITNSAGTGVTNISESLISNAIIAINVPYLYTLTANGCSNTQTVNASVNPTPNLSNQLITVCSGNAFKLTPANVPLNTQYVWAAPVKNPLGSIIGGTAQAASQNFISETLSNSSTNNATASYVVTPDANGCTGTSFDLVVTVNPVPILSSTLSPTAVCSNTVFNYIPASNTIGTAFSWTRATVSGISNPAGGGVNNPGETLVNITTQVIPVQYTFAITTSGGCVNSQVVTVSVNPAPQLSSTLTPTAICSGTLFNYTPQSLAANPSFSWSRSITSSISNGAAIGANSVSELLVNTSINTISVPYNYTISSNGCSSVQTVTVSVNPSPIIGNQSTTSCSNTFFTVNPTNVPAGTQYTWSAPTYNPAGSLNGGSVQTIVQNNITQLLGNQTINPAVATYSVTPVANGCFGVSFAVSVTVNPAPVIGNQTIAAVCSGTAFNYSATNIPSGTTYTWSSPIQNPQNTLTGGSAQSVNQNSVSQVLRSVNNLSDTAIYTVTPVTNGCIGNNFNLTVPVSPVPVVNNIADTICTGSSFNINPSPVPFNTTYTWGTPVSFPFGAVVGGNAQTVASTNISQILFNSTSTPAQLVYTVVPSAFGCRGNSFTLVETVGSKLPIIPNSNFVICSNTSFDATPLSAPPNSLYTWSIQNISPARSVSGSSAVTIAQKNIQQNLTNLTNVTDTVVYAITPFNTGCFGSAFTATIRVLPVPKATISGKPVVCRYPQDTLSVSFVGTAPWSFTYVDNNVTYTKTGITSSPYNLIVPAIPLLPKRTFTINYATDNACIDSINTSTFIQAINPLPVGEIVSLHGLYICNNIPDTLFVRYPVTDTLSFKWKYNENIVPGLITDSIVTLTQGRYNAQLTNQYGCIDTAASPIELTYLVQPKLAFNYDIYCINKPIRFTNLTDTTLTGPIQWLWDYGDSTSSANYHGTNTYLTAGSRHVKLSATQFYCPANTTSLDTTINVEFPLPSLRLPSVSAYTGVQKPLNGRTYTNYRYLWTPSRGIDQPTSASVLFNYQNTQDYIINLIAPSGCITYDSLLVRVFDNKLVDVFVPKSFTPNGDGVNDLLLPYLAGIKTFQYFKIYDRYGKLLFETKDPDKGWNGFFNGNPQPMSIYIWVAVGIADDGSQVQKKGETLLLR